MWTIGSKVFYWIVFGFMHVVCRKSCVPNLNVCSVVFPKPKLFVKHIQIQV